MLGEIHNFGYGCLGPIMLQFLMWLSKEAADQKVEHLFFLAREGYLLQDYYTKYASLDFPSKRTEIPSSYLLTSRRAMFGALPKTRNYMQYILAAGAYKGLLSNLLSARVGIDIEDLRAMGIDDREVVLPTDEACILDICEKHRAYLDERTDAERTAMMEYFEGTGLLGMKRVGLVDLGYSASIQRCLYNITRIPMVGFYFAGTTKAKEWQCPSNTVLACFGADHTEPPPAFVALESFLTSPDGQLLKFLPGGKPVFGEPGSVQKSFSTIEEISDGVKHYFEDVVALDWALDGLDWICRDVMVEGLFASRNRKWVRSLSLEDSFCGTGDMSLASRFGLVDDEFDESQSAETHVDPAVLSQS